MFFSQQCILFKSQTHDLFSWWKFWQKLYIIITIITIYEDEKVLPLLSCLGAQESVSGSGEERSLQLLVSLFILAASLCASFAFSCIVIQLNNQLRAFLDYKGFNNTSQLNQRDRQTYNHTVTTWLCSRLIIPHSPLTNNPRYLIQNKSLWEGSVWLFFW